MFRVPLYRVSAADTSGKISRKPANADVWQSRSSIIWNALVRSKAYGLATTSAESSACRITCAAQLAKDLNRFCRAPIHRAAWQWNTTTATELGAMRIVCPTAATNRGGWLRGSAGLTGG